MLRRATSASEFPPKRVNMEAHRERSPDQTPRRVPAAAQGVVVHVSVMRNLPNRSRFCAEAYDRRRPPVLAGSRHVPEWGLRQAAAWGKRRTAVVDGLPAIQQKPAR